MPAVLLAGSGGQGVLFAGRLLAQAAMREGRNITWFPSYGAEVRGGTANCTVVISRGFIGSPIVRHPDVLVVLNEPSLRRFQERLKPQGLLVLNSSLCGRPPERGDIRVLSVPADDIALEVAGPLSANMVALAAAAAAARLCSLESLQEALKELTPQSKRHLLEPNLQALRQGWQHAG
jgi:2-oxoglutarate ferredoxin oxidoreductase subunit gamma